jgi:Ser/Thr protein kinase RdoA (MazF antagonist)
MPSRPPAALSDARVLALNSYENRVYQVGIEDAAPVIAKFYRPNRWSDAQIREEHAFCVGTLRDADLPVVAPHRRLARRHAASVTPASALRCFPRKGGQAPEPGDPEQMHRIGTLLGRIHAVAPARAPSQNARRWTSPPSSTVPARHPAGRAASCRRPSPTAIRHAGRTRCA